MNKQEILNLKAGNELDSLVREVVIEGLAEENEGCTGSMVENYSTDASTMWNIINIFVKRDFTYTITNNSNYEHSCIFDSIKSHKRYIAHSENLAEAVCKAALMAALGETA
jgi:hypothetical protein